MHRQAVKGVYVCAVSCLSLDAPSDPSNILTWYHNRDSSHSPLLYGPCYPTEFPILETQEAGYKAKCGCQCILMVFKILRIPDCLRGQLLWSHKAWVNHRVEYKCQVRIAWKFPVQSQSVDPILAKTTRHWYLVLC